MRAREVLQRYAAGERNFQRMNLRGLSFSGKDLSGADFSEADIRGTNFSRANLTGAKFRGAKAGLQRRWVVILLAISWLLAALSGFLSQNILNYFSLLASKFEVVTDQVFYNALLLCFTLIWSSIIIEIYPINLKKIFDFCLKIIPAHYIFIIFGVVFVAIIGVFRIFAIAIIFVSILYFVLNIIFTCIITCIVEVFNRGTFVYSNRFFAIIIAIFFTYFIIGNNANEANIIFFNFVILGGLFNQMFIYLSIYNWRYFVGIHNVAIAFAAIGGTNFHRANLSNADFSKATLKSTDLRGAILIRTCWRDTEKLDRIQLGISILRQPQIRELLKTGNGYGKFFLKANLWSANLQRANLENANLKQSNLSNATLCDTNLTNANLSEAQLWNTDFSNASLVEANLRDANLSEANLSNANLAITTALNTNFESVTLTGACIHDWNINSNTKFDNVICEYIFLGIGFTDRRPSDLNTIFEPGDFARLFQKLHETADLIFRDGINWQAFSTSFQALKAEQVKVEGDDRAFSVRAIENLDDGSFVVRINTPKGADKAEIERLFQEKYEGELKRLEGVYRERLQAKDEQIEQYKRENTNLWELAKLGAARPINVENKAVADQSKSDRSIHIKANEFKGAANVEKIEGGAVYNEGYNIYNANAPEKQTLAETAKEIQDLLKQLEESNPTTTKTEEMLVAAEAIKEIESKPTLKQKAINAAKGGALEVLKQNPIGAFVAGAIEGWTNEG